MDVERESVDVVRARRDKAQTDYDKAFHEVQQVRWRSRDFCWVGLH
jgi:hypothetical protein